MDMDTNTLVIVGGGLALAGLVLRQGSRLERRLDSLQAQIVGLQTRMDGGFETVQTQLAGLHDQISGCRERLARIEGILTRQTASAEEALRAQG